MASSGQRKAVLEKLEMSYYTMCGKPCEMNAYKIAPYNVPEAL